MIGLEYILAITNTKHMDLAEELNMSRQNINLWISQKQLVSKKYLSLLSEKFNQPQEIFNKVVDNNDKVLILSNEIGRISKVNNY